MVRALPATGTPEVLSALGYDGTTWDRPWHLARGQLTTVERMPSVELDPGGAPTSIERGDDLVVGELTFTDPLTGRAMSGDQFLDRRLYTDALAVVQDGRLVYESYRNGMTESDRHVAHSCSKTLTTMMVGIAIEEGKLDRSRPIAEYVPELAQIPAWDPVTLEHVLDMATGIDLEEDYERRTRCTGGTPTRWATTPGRPAGQVGALGFATDELTKAIEPPGVRFNYGSYLTNLLPIAVANVYGVPALDLYEDRIYRHLGAERPALVNVDSAGNPIVEGQVNLTLRDFVRWGYLLADEGRSLGGEQVDPVTLGRRHVCTLGRARRGVRAGQTADAFPGAEYHNQTWVLEPGRVVSMLGIHGQFCWIDRGTRTMIVGFSSYPVQTHALLGATLRELWTTVRGALSG